MSIASQTYATYAYRRPSRLSPEGGLELQTSGGMTPSGLVANPRFFDGFLSHPQAAAAGLLAVADVAAANYHQPRPALLDPVVTGNGDRLRFESFSGCCGVYARLDVLPEGFDGWAGHGTTNIDVNVPLRDALSRLTGGEPLQLSAGPDEVVARTLDGPMVERKVPLPERWVRGFGEVQVISAGFSRRAVLPAVEAVRFLRALPRGGAGSGSRGGSRGGSGGAQWVVPAGRTLRLTSRAVPGAVCLPGPARLAALGRVLRFARALTVYGPPGVDGEAPPGVDGEAVGSAWELELPGARLTLTLSPSPARGFSGEGAVLTALAAEGSEEDAEDVAGLLSWDPRIEVADLAECSGLPTARVRAALGRLGAAGRVGYDTAEAGYFHRELPFDARFMESANPRLRDARALLAAGAVRLEEGGATEAGATKAGAGEAGGGSVGGGAAGDGSLVVATVTADQHTNRVRLHTTAAGVATCTCRWWARYRGGRGPCKHVLAVQLLRQTQNIAQRSAT